VILSLHFQPNKEQ